MTSKEALNRLSKYIGELGGGETLEEEVILKDLEVLEILKESITDKEAHMIVMKDEITEKMKGEEFMILHYTIKGTEKVNKVKEWLENKE
jgi:hypothetical protein